MTGRPAHAYAALLAAVATGWFQAAAACRAAPAPGLWVDAAPDRIFLGETFTLTVRVAGDDDVAPPDLDALPPGQRELTDHKSDSATLVRMSGMNLEKEARPFQVFTYRIRPAAPGPFRTGPVRVARKNGPVAAEGPTVDVTGPTDQDDVRILLRTTRSEVMVGEPFGVQVAVLIPAPGDGRADGEPLDLRSPPWLDIPFLAPVTIEGLDRPDPRDWLRERLVVTPSKPGFHINNYTVGPDPLRVAPAAGTGARRARFALDRETVEIDGAAYLRYTLTARHTPHRTGMFVFGPVIFRGHVLRTPGTAGGAQPVRVMAAAPEVTVHAVLPDPRNQPETFIGAIGREVTVETALDRYICGAGSPVTLQVTVAGVLNPHDLTAPLLSRQAGLRRWVHVHDEADACSRTADGGVFTYTLRPRSTGTVELPPIHIAYFDVRHRAYRHAFSAPLPLQVKPPADNVTSPPAGAPARPAVAPLALGPDGARAVCMRSLVLGMRPASAGPPDRLHVFLWQQAAALTSNARTRDAFERAADAWRRALEAGLVNGPVLLNLSTAQLMAGRTAETPAVINRAVRYLGVTPEIRLNRAFCRRAGGRDLPPRSWETVVFFWHTSLSVAAQTRLALLGLVLVAAGLARSRSPARRGGGLLLAAAGGLLGIALGLSVVTSAWTETSLRSPRSAYAPATWPAGRGGTP